VTNFEFMEAAEARVKELWRKLEERDGKKLPSPEVDFSLRSRGTAGMSWKGKVYFNLAYVKNNAKKMIDETIPHEVAHAWLTATRDPSHISGGINFYTGRRKKRNVHGDTFRATVQFLGGQGRRTHDMTPDLNMVRTRKTQRWAYRCECCKKELQVSTVVHNRMLRGTRYIHPKCGSSGVLTPIYNVRRIG